jgi:nitrite reductase/ring-hydroxylating ferredoxin subunit
MGLGTAASDAGAAVPVRRRDATTGETARLTTPLTWPAIAHASQIPVGHSVQFTFGAGSKWAGKAGAVYRESQTTFTVFDLVCTHRGCTAVPMGAAAHCPCHGSSFSLATGAATAGPALQLNTGGLTPSRFVVRNGVIRWVRDL